MRMLETLHHQMEVKRFRAGNVANYRVANLDRADRQEVGDARIPNRLPQGKDDVVVAKSSEC